MSKIQVAIRVRPEVDSSKVSKNMQITRENGIDLYLNASKHEFAFDKVFADTSSQEIVFRQSATNIINDVIEGYNGCILTYGQTGAGKTYTMSGPSADNYEERGMVSRTAAAIFHKCSQLKDSVTIRLSVLEIYNETLIDLLREPNTTVPSSNVPEPPPKLSIIESSSGVSVPALYVLPISSEDDAYTHLLEAYQNRVVAEHQLNRKSSRSHVIFTFYITRTRSDDDVVVQSKLNLVDLAGSERVEKTGTVGINQKEASYINKSLSFLEQVVLALSQAKREHIPYRQSKLTYILKDSLGGNCATYLIACVWPSQLHEWETLSTLRFATRMKCIENHPIRNTLVSKEPQSIRLVQQIEQLKRELVMRDTMNQMDPWLPDLTKSQKAKTIKLVSAIANDRPSGHDLSIPADVDLDLKSISQCKLMLGFMRRCLWESNGGDYARVAAVVQGVAASSIGYDGFSPVPGGNKGAGGNRLSLDDKGGHDSNLGDGVGSFGLAGGFNDNNENSYQSPNKGYLQSNAKGGSKVSPIALDSLSGNNNNNSNNSNSNSSRSNMNNSLTNNDEEEAVLQGMRNAASINDNETLIEEGSAAQEVTTITFETFSAGAGKVYHDSFMDTKEALKANKNRQREIIQILNRQKIIIDTCSEVIRKKEKFDRDPDAAADGADDDLSDPNQGKGLEPSEMTGEYISGIRMQLESSKRDYRAAHTELQICKKQVGELEVLKQRALAVLLKEFDEFSKNIIGGGGAV